MWGSRDDPRRGGTWCNAGSSSGERLARAAQHCPGSLKSPKQLRHASISPVVLHCPRPAIPSGGGRGSSLTEAPGGGGGEGGKHEAPQFAPDCGASMTTVGLGRVELPTSRLSGVRSNHLSYRPCITGLDYESFRRSAASPPIAAWPFAGPEPVFVFV